MEHDHNVGAQLQRLVITGFLVAAVTPVLIVPDDVPDAQFAGHGYRPVAAVIIHQHDLVHDLERDLGVGLKQGQFSIIGGKDNDQLFTFNHTISKIEGKPTSNR